MKHQIMAWMPMDDFFEGKEKEKGKEKKKVRHIKKEY